MSVSPMAVRCGRLRTAALLLAGLATLGAAARGADDKAHADGKHVAVGKVASEDGSVLRRGAHGWEALKKGDAVHTGVLLVGLPGAAIDTTNGAVRVAMLADLDEASPLPIYDTAILFREPKGGHDLDLSIDRGRVDLVSRKKAGAVKARVDYHHEAWELSLTGAEARLAVEAVGRWPAGVPFSPEHKAGHGPVCEAVIVMLKGEADLKTGRYQHHLKAPPGPAYFQWDSVSGGAPEVGIMQQIPDWAKAEEQATARGRERKKNIELFRMTVNAKGVSAAIKDALASDDPLKRRMAIIAMGAFDDLPGLAAVALGAKSVQDRENVIATMRHWIGRGHEQDRKMYDFLTKERKYSPAHASIVLNLLHDFSADQEAQPETYETLIEYLRHKQPGVRGLAAWHLYRLAPQGRDIAYDPTAGPDEQEKAYNAWKKLIPSGKLPPKAKDKAGAGAAR